jgi:protein transport protein YIF1
MYIPVMAIVTYILLSTLLAGIRGTFHPELMGSTFGYALFVVFAEIFILKLGTYFLSITNESQLLDLIAYSGYKFVGVIITLVISETINLGQGTGGWIGWIVFFYTYLANAFFLVCNLPLFAIFLTISATFFEIRSLARFFGARRRRQSRGTVTSQSEDAIPVRLLVCGAAPFHVGT